MLYTRDIHNISKKASDLEEFTSGLQGTFSRTWIYEVCHIWDHRSFKRAYHLSHLIIMGFMKIFFFRIFLIIRGRPFDRICDCRFFLVWFSSNPNLLKSDLDLLRPDLSLDWWLLVRFRQLGAICVWSCLFDLSLLVIFCFQTWSLTAFQHI